jgi:8-oxo-dGTP pyrophosphatase MutT (NUDIX family)
MVVLEDPDGRVLVTMRTDNGQWCLPAGAAEAGGSFAETAIVEAREEVGVGIAREDLRAFGTLSGADEHTIEYPNRDLTHCFAVLFAVRRWHGTPRADGKEVGGAPVRRPRGAADADDETGRYCARALRAVPVGRAVSTRVIRRPGRYPGFVAIAQIATA